MFGNTDARFIQQIAGISIAILVLVATVYTERYISAILTTPSMIAFAMAMWANRQIKRTERGSKISQRI